MRTYEVLFILHPQLAEQESTDLIQEFRTIAEAQGAKLISEDAWGKRRLAYPIQKLNEGIYHLFVFEADGDMLSEVDRKMKNSDRVLRHVIVRTDLDQKRAAKLAAKVPAGKKKRAAAAAAASAAAEPASEPSTETPAEPATTESAPPEQPATEAASGEPAAAAE